jgi:bifunctional DNA-binding transcriptional regulator/antitoxin component of YhaV-PrlF toxin-antitoxin module
MTTIQIRSKGSVTLPISLRNKYNLDEGDFLSLIDIGDGSFMLVPKLSEVNRLGDRISTIMNKEEITLDDLLIGLDEERERFYQDRYAKS